jgi:divalent metal cation (Fe/Co/Zn/Cd) transporter
MSDVGGERPEGAGAPTGMTSNPIGIAGGERRAEAVSRALRLEVVTIVWMTVEAVGAIGAGLLARSTLLLAFGIDSVIELASAGVLYKRLRIEAAGGDTHRVEATEAKAGRIGGTLLFILAAYVVATSIYKLFHRGGADESYVGLAIAAVAAVGMPLLARAKIRVADRIGSRALRADAMETFTCGYMSWILLAGLGANALLHWWWLDGAGALVLVPLLIKEGREAFTGRCLCDHES